jgi:hypothetical protein
MRRGLANSLKYLWPSLSDGRQSLAHGTEELGSRIGPGPLGGAERDAQFLGRLFLGQADNPFLRRAEAVEASDRCDCVRLNKKTQPVKTAPDTKRT